MRSHRPERVANIIRMVVSEAIATKLSDPRIAPMSSITRVEVSGDLEIARVYVSVMGEPAVGRRTIAGLESATGYVQGLLAKELPIRNCPKISFYLDESIKKAAETIWMIDEAMAELHDDSADQSPEEHEGPSGGNDE